MKYRVVVNIKPECVKSNKSMSYCTDDTVEDNKTYFDVGSEKVWFQTEYDFYPQIGQKLLGDDLFPSDDVFGWCDDGSYTIIDCTVMSRNTILLFCEMASENQIELLESIKYKK